jgi:hypothetical protein
VVLALAVVMAGTGHLPTLKLLRGGVEGVGVCVWWGGRHSSGRGSCSTVQLGERECWGGCQVGGAQLKLSLQLG